MKLALAIWVVMDLLTGGNREDADERRGRLWTPAYFIAVETRDIPEAARNVTQAMGESHLVRHVMWNQCRPGTCDVTKRGHFRAKGPFQNWRIDTKPEWAALWDEYQGHSTMQSIVRLNVQMMRANACGGNVAHQFSAMDGKGCRDTGRGRVRSQKARTIEGMIRRELARLEAK